MIELWIVVVKTLAFRQQKSKRFKTYKQTTEVYRNFLLYFDVRIPFPNFVTPFCVRTLNSRKQ